MRNRASDASAAKPSNWRFAAASLALPASRRLALVLTYINPASPPKTARNPHVFLVCGNGLLGPPEASFTAQRTFVANACYDRLPWIAPCCRSRCATGRVPVSAGEQLSGGVAPMWRKTPHRDMSLALNSFGRVA
jgi:hypothetical protein